jgi:hypothetical protein
MRWLWLGHVSASPLNAGGWEGEETRNARGDGWISGWTDEWAAAIKAAADRLELQVILAGQGPERRGSRVQSQNAESQAGVL